LIRDSALEAFADVDLILHAGDIGSRDIFRALDRVAPVRAVRGNSDADDWGQCLAGTMVVQAAGRRLYMLHDLDRLALDPQKEGFAAVIYGHSHRPAADWNDGVLYINPGSAGPCLGHQQATVALLEISQSGIVHRFVDLR